MLPARIRIENLAMQLTGHKTRAVFERHTARP